MRYLDLITGVEGELNVLPLDPLDLGEGDVLSVTLLALTSLTPESVNFFSKGNKAAACSALRDRFTAIFYLLYGRYARG